MCKISLSLIFQCNSCRDKAVFVSFCFTLRDCKPESWNSFCNGWELSFKTEPQMHRSFTLFVLKCFFSSLSELQSCFFFFFSIFLALLWLFVPTFLLLICWYLNVCKALCNLEWAKGRKKRVSNRHSSWS